MVQQWDRAISSLVIRSSLGFSFGVIFSVLLFKRRAWPVWLGTGFGAGRAWEEADGTSPLFLLLHTLGFKTIRLFLIRHIACGLRVESRWFADVGNNSKFQTRKCTKYDRGVEKSEDGEVIIFRVG